MSNDPSQTPREKWEHKGFIDYPRNDLFPYRDRFGPRCEKWYLTGWHKRARVEMHNAWMEEEE